MKLTIELNEKDYASLIKHARHYFLSPEELINHMIGDLTCGSNTLGSNERILMSHWYNHAGVNFDHYDENALMCELEQIYQKHTKYLNEHGISKLFTDTITLAVIIYKMTERYNVNSDLFSIRYKSTFPQNKQMDYFIYRFKTAYDDMVKERFKDYYVKGLLCQRINE